MQSFIQKMLLLTCGFLFIIQNAFAEPSPFITLPDQANLYYEEVGSGQTILFIPGWTATHQFFSKQVSYFSSKYRVITFDPRGQGLSPVTLNNNDYLQHGKDLASLINQLKLKNVVLVGWSWGCYDAYAYVRQYGVNNIRAFVCIDAAPKAFGSEGQWRASVNQSDIGGIIQQLENNRYSFTSSWVQSMLEKPLDNIKRKQVVDEVLRTPTYVALLLMFDALNSDYSPEAKLLDQSQIPMLEVISETMEKDAKAWLTSNAPQAHVEIMGKHMMFWERSDEFNPILEDFIKNSLIKDAS